MNLNITILILEKDSFPKCSYYFVFVPSLINTLIYIIKYITYQEKKKKNKKKSYKNK